MNQEGQPESQTAKKKTEEEKKLDAVIPHEVASFIDEEIAKRASLIAATFKTEEVPKTEGTSEEVSVNEQVIAKLTREIDELKKEAETFESQRKRGEQSLREIARKLNMVI